MKILACGSRNWTDHELIRDELARHRDGGERADIPADELPDLVVAFQRGGSRGTQYTIDEALRRHIRVVLVRRP